jgi:hypothetical protein
MTNFYVWLSYKLNDVSIIGCEKIALQVHLWRANTVKKLEMNLMMYVIFFPCF